MEYERLKKLIEQTIGFKLKSELHVSDARKEQQYASDICKFEVCICIVAKTAENEADLPELSFKLHSRCKDFTQAELQKHFVQAWKTGQLQFQNKSYASLEDAEVILQCLHNQTFVVPRHSSNVSLNYDPSSIEKWVLAEQKWKNLFKLSQLSDSELELKMAILGI